MKLAILAIGALSLAQAAQAQTTVIGNVCGVPTWHHAGGQIFMFQVNPLTPLPGNLTAQSFYYVPMTSPSNPVGAGTTVQAVDVVVRQALKQPGCFDVTTDQATTDDGTGNRAIDHDAPNE